MLLLISKTISPYVKWSRGANKFGVGYEDVLMEGDHGKVRVQVFSCGY